MPVFEAIIAVTSRCNARCTMCDIWQKKSDDEVEPSFYYHLPKTLKNINITGGEPFLRKDLDKIVKVMTGRCQKLRPVISTNGLLVNRIKDIVPRILKLNSRLAVRVSIDGIGQTHDEVRGVEGAYEKALDSIAVLKEAGVKDLGIGFTLLRKNQSEMIKVFELSKKLGLQFTSTIAHSSPIFFGDQKDQEPDRKIAAKNYIKVMNRQLSSYQPKDWFRAYFTEGIIDMVNKKPRKIQCPALSEFFYLSPSGDVFPCHLLDEPLGKLSDAPFEELVDSIEGGKNRYRHCLMQCWMTCTVAPEMRRNPLSVLWWVLKRKTEKLVFRAGS